MSEVAVIGAGTMGSGIAQVAATHGWRVRLVDVDAAVANRAIERIRGQLDRAVERQRMSASDRDAALSLLSAASIADLGGCELVVEAIVEDLDVKTRILGEATQIAPRTAILASNTSSLSITRIGESIGCPERTLGMHFFNPAPVMPLVEVIAGSASAADCLERAVEIAAAWGKTPVRAKDTPGFIVNRVARGYYLEPLRMLDEGVSGVSEIDQILKTLGGFRMGPFELMDLIGIDVNYSVSRSVWEQLGRPARLQPHELQVRLVEQHHYGRKTKQGFYSYQPAHPYPAVVVARKSFELPDDVYKAVRLFCQAGTDESGSITEQYVFARTLAAIINEAAWALDGDVATAEDIDTAMRLGVNYPRGPIEWAERIGRRTCRHLLDTLNRHASDGRFAAAQWLRT
ncbi:MAG: 3-hydroxyacyl-CoA dehydrogenase [Phycisphaerae bacterium]|jgi:3-hydroxybutyryl-CoA dehydrogenase